MALDVAEREEQITKAQGLRSWFPISLSRLVSWEFGFYLVLLVLAGLVRFWDLGSRALHHDESLHTFFSLDFLNSYQHNPLMHGPFQFFGLNLTYSIFGESDVSARAMPALFGTVLVGLPYFLRGYLGRWGSMASAVLIAFSPTLLYFSRFVRNDIYMAVWTLGLVICVWNFLDRGKARFLYLAVALLSLSFATKENSYIIGAILGSFLFLLWLQQPFQSRESGSAEDRASLPTRTGIDSALKSMAVFLRRTRAYLVPSAFIFIAMLGWMLSSFLWSLDIYDILGRVDLRFSLISLGLSIGLYVALLPWVHILKPHRDRMAHRLSQWFKRVPPIASAQSYLRAGSLQKLSRPGMMWLLMLLLALPLTAAFLGLIQDPFDLTLVNPSSLGGTNEDHKAGFPEGAPVGNISIAIAVGVAVYLFVISVSTGLRWNWRRFLIGSAIFWGIFAILYTTLFTNIWRGLGSGLWDSLGYWVAQQDVRRGEQPWYYYFLLGGAYEFLSLFLLLVGAAWYILVQKWVRRLNFWWVHGVLVACTLLLVLSSFWMPDSPGQQLAIGTLLLVAAASLVIWYGRLQDRDFIRSRVVVGDVVLFGLLVLNWTLQRLFAVWDFILWEAIWDARDVLSVVVLWFAIALVTLKSLGTENKFIWFLVYWLGTSIVLYSFAAEKMPWLMVHIALPMAILGGVVCERLIQGARRRSLVSSRLLIGVVSIVVVGVLGFQSIKVSTEAAYGLDREGNGDVPKDMLVYTQTSPDIITSLAKIDDLAKTTGKGENLAIVIDRTRGFGSPWRWYLRDYTNVQWPCYHDNPSDETCAPMKSPPDADVVIIHHWNRDASIEYLTEFDSGQRIRHRAWFPEFETYKKGSGPYPLEDFFQSLVSADSWRQWWNFFVFRELDEDKPLGSEDSVVFFRLQDGITGQDSVE